MKIPSAGTPVSPLSLARAFLPIGGTETFRTAIQMRVNVPWCGLTGSGTSAIYACLRALKKQSGRTGIVLPAYTAPSLILPIRKAGLSPVLCDICPETLNAGPEELLSRVNGNTLAVMPVHMFGLPTDVPAIAQHLGDTGVAVLEDAASAQGARMGDREVGAFGDIGIYSFNRGKNLSTLSGGAILTSRTDWIPALKAEIAAFPRPNAKQRLKICAFATALGIIVRPLGYTLLHPLAAPFKYTALHADFRIDTYTDFQARLGCALLKKLDAFTAARESNARFLRQALEPLVGLPRLLPGSCPAHNQFPILLPDETMRTALHRAICDTGLEATLLYPDPIHRLYPDIWDGIGSDPYPNATDISRRLLLLPAHPLVPRRALERAVEIIEKTIKSGRRET